jgi:hypothetical protein
MKNPLRGQEGGGGGGAFSHNAWLFNKSEDSILKKALLHVEICFSCCLVK